MTLRGLIAWMVNAIIRKHRHGQTLNQHWPVNPTLFMKLPVHVYRLDWYSFHGDNCHNNYFPDRSISLAVGPYFVVNVNDGVVNMHKNLNAGCEHQLHGKTDIDGSCKIIQAIFLPYFHRFSFFFFFFFFFLGGGGGRPVTASTSTVYHLT